MTGPAKSVESESANAHDKSFRNGKGSMLYFQLGHDSFEYS